MPWSIEQRVNQFTGEVIRSTRMTAGCNIDAYPGISMVFYCNISMLSVICLSSIFAVFSVLKKCGDGEMDGGFRAFLLKLRFVLENK